MSADGAERYFDEALKRTDYYAKEVGLWGGKGAQRLRVMPPNVVTVIDVAG